MYRVLAIGWSSPLLTPANPSTAASHFEFVSITHEKSLGSEITGSFDLVAINGHKSLTLFDRIETLLESNRDRVVVFENEYTPEKTLQSLRKRDFLWQEGPITEQKLLMSIENVQKLEVRENRASGLTGNLRDYLALFHKSIDHEFQTPLNTISTAIHLLTNYESELHTDERSEQMQYASEACSRLQTLVKDIQAYSELHKANDALPVERLEVQSIIQTAIDVAISNRTATRSRIDFAETDVPYIVAGNHSALADGLSRIISNALKFSQDVVTISLQVNQSNLEIFVSDKGVGIPKEDLDKVFVPYLRTGETDAHQGVGLGLAIAKHSIELSGGTLSVQSQIGAGSTFTISVPLARPLS